MTGLWGGVHVHWSRFHLINGGHYFSYSFYFNLFLIISILVVHTFRLPLTLHHFWQNWKCVQKALTTGRFKLSNFFVCVWAVWFRAEWCSNNWIRYSCLENFSHFTRTLTNTHAHVRTLQICNKTYYVTREETWMFLKWIML